ncbi:hypothetical protein X946_5553 [Burkholderia sp. ABCPW 111]|nr:hypothetical protein X946_5553 [Burkholderia sp. ABCPW 111]
MQLRKRQGFPRFVERVLYRSKFGFVFHVEPVPSTEKLDVTYRLSINKECFE